MSNDKNNTKLFTIGAAAVTSLVTTLVLWRALRLLKKPSPPPIERFNVNARSSASIRYGNLVFVSGQINSIPDDIDGMYDIEEQTLAALRYVDQALKNAGSDKSKILDVTIFLADIERDYDRLHVVYDAWISPVRLPPCKTCVQAELFSPLNRVELKVVAAI